MTVKSLIEELAKMPQDMDVFIPDPNDEEHYVPAEFVRTVEMNEDEEGFIVEKFNAVVIECEEGRLIN